MNVVEGRSADGIAVTVAILAVTHPGAEIELRCKLCGWTGWLSGPDPDAARYEFDKHGCPDKT